MAIREGPGEDGMRIKRLNLRESGSLSKGVTVASIRLEMEIP